MQTVETDMLIIGGGINGCGIAADAAGRGLSVVLCEKGDLASATSSWSSKLIHGGLRYLEQYDFKLVREALKEREVLLKKAPHLIHPLKFVLPHNAHLRPAWMIRAGLFLYDHLAKRTSIPGSRKINLRSETEGKPLKQKYKVGFSYYDCQTDDARLVILNALSAQANGATILPRTLCQNISKQNNKWQATLLGENNETIIVYAKAVINASGPWVIDTLRHVIHSESKSNVKQVKGSHIVIPKMYAENHAYILQNADGRIVFTIPFHNDYTLIGTTDIPYHDDLDCVKINDDEIQYLLATVNQYFTKPITADDIIWTYSGVRPLYDDQSENPSKISREYHFELEQHDHTLALLSIFGGKITTFRTLAEHALEKLLPFFPDMGPPWTANALLPGGELKQKDFAQFLKLLKSKYNWLPAEQLARYANHYGSFIDRLLENCNKMGDLGEHIGADLYQREVDYLIQYEWAKTTEDIIWRRTKLGLKLTPDEITRIKL